MLHARGHHFFALSSLTLILTIASSAIGRAADPNSAPAKKTAPAPAPASASARPKEKLPTDAECRQWGKLVQSAIASGDIDKFNRQIDWDAFLETATTVPDETPEIAASRQKFAQAFKSTVTSKPAGFAPVIMASIKNGGSYRMLRSHIVDGRKRVLFRLINTRGAVNYHDFILSRSAQGNLIAVDWHIFLMGELSSQTTRRNYLPLVALSSHATLDQLAQTDRDFLTHLKDFQALTQNARDKKHSEVLEIYKRLPPSLQRNKSVLILRFASAQVTNEGEYLTAIDDFRTAYPHDALLDMISVDALLQRKKYDQALECIERLDRSVGGDPYLKVTRARILGLQGKMPAAHIMGQRAVSQEPSLINGYYLLLDLSLKTREFDETVRLLKSLTSKFGIQFSDFSQAPEFAEFVKSPQYQSWLQSRSKTP